MAAAIPAIVGVASGIFAGTSEQGRNNANIGNFTQDKGTGFDPRRLEYGGGYERPNGVWTIDFKTGQPVQGTEWVSGEQVGRERAEGLGATFGQMGADASTRSAAELNPYLMDKSRDLGMGSRGEQVTSLGDQRVAMGMARDAAMGVGPSVAQEQLKMGLDQNLQNQLSAAASVRGGPGAAALAARSAMMQGVTASQKTAGDAAMLRAQEIAAARGQFLTGSEAAARTATGIRANDSAVYDADLRRAGMNLDAEMKQRVMNDEYRKAMAANQIETERMRHAVNMGGMMGRTAEQDMRRGAFEFQQGGNANIDAHNAAFKERRFQNMMGSFASAATSAASMGDGGGNKVQNPYPGGPNGGASKDIGKMGGGGTEQAKWMY